jgi:hypothetical protein
MIVILIWLLVGLLTGIAWHIFSVQRHSIGDTALWLFATTILGPFTLIGFIACIVESTGKGGD